MTTYQTYNNYLKKRFGKSVLKIPLNGGFTCPNIDGTKSTGGCIYCDNVAFSPVASSVDPVLDQLRDGISRGKRRFELFIGYFQSFSNTHAPVEKLKELYEPVINYPDVIGIAVGTRPDCFSNEIYHYLSDVNKRCYLSVEIGVQTAHNQTLDFINRQHTFEESIESIEKLASLDIETVAHVMLGLPGETREMMIKTADAIAALPVNGVKIHQLMIIKGTKLERELYQHGKINVLSIEEYAELLGSFLSHLRSDQIIHRIMADSRIESGLLAPLWSAEKRTSLQYLQNFLKANSFAQGKECLTRVIHHIFKGGGIT